jgi:hypothetical protein
MSPARTPTLVTRFVIPASSGSTKHLEQFFKAKVRVDQTFQNFVDNGGPDYRTERLDCRIYQSIVGCNSDEAIISSLTLGRHLNMHLIPPILKYLGSEGISLLSIPEGTDRANLILGYSHISGVKYVLFIRHKTDVDHVEYHLLARPTNHWRPEDTPMVIVAN